MGVFHVIERNVWQRGIMIIGLLGMAALFYVMTTKPPNELLQFRTGVISQREVAPAAEDRIDAANASEQGHEQQEVVAVVASSESSLPSDNTLRQYLFERDRQRAARIEHLQTLIQHGVLEYEDVQPAEQLLRLLEYAEKEEQAERILQARGIEDVFVAISESQVHVVVSKVIKKDEVSTVGTIVSQVTGQPLSNITISDGATSL